MILEMLSPTGWVTLAGGLYILGYLFINQVYLRLCMLGGSLAYIAPLQPGDFRALVQRAKRFVVEQDMTVTQQGEQPEKVYFVIDGTFNVQKGAAEFEVYGPTFVGEVAYLLSSPSAATTVLPAGTQVLEWTLSDLITRSARQPRFKLALDAVISRDLARKVSLAVSPEARLRAQGLGTPNE